MPTRRLLFALGAIALLGGAPTRSAHAAKSASVDMAWVHRAPPGGPERTYALAALSPHGGTPAGAVAPRFTSFQFADDAPCGVAVDVGAKPPIVWVDRDRDGKYEPNERTALTPHAEGYVGRLAFDLTYTGREAALPCEIELVYRPKAEVGSRFAVRAQVFRRGKAVVAGRVRRIALVDGDGDLRFEGEHDYVLIDHDCNARFDTRIDGVERTSLVEPLRIGLDAYTVRLDAADGARLRLVPHGGHAEKGLKPPSSVDLLEKAAAERGRERAVALRELRQIRHPLAIEVAEGLVEDSGITHADRMLLIQVLSESGTPQSVDAMIRLYLWIGLPANLRERIVRSLAEVRQRHATQRWMRLLRSPSRRMRIVATRLLAVQPDPAAGKALVAQGAREEDARVLDALIDALATRPSADAATFLIESARRGGAKREVAVRALGRIGFGVPEVRAFFGELLRARSPEERLLALDLVASSEDADFCPRVSPSLEHRAWEVRQASIEALSRLKCQTSVDALIQRLGHEPRRRLEVALGKALWRLTGVYFYEDAERWRTWWTLHRKDFVFPDDLVPLPDVEAGGTTEGFYGIPLDSEHVLFVIDRSGSMDAIADSETGASRWDIAVREVLRAVRPFSGKAEAGVLLFASDVRAWQTRLRRMTPSARKGLRKFLDGNDPEGGTNLYDALERAYAYRGADTIFVVSDGIPSAGRYKKPHQVLRALEKLAAGRRVKVHCVSVGMDSRLLEEISAFTGGTYVRR